jgi:CopG-like RHH_1 or ribbon-helix-helix domain, RHH_5
VVKRINVTFPDDIYSKLEALSEIEVRPIANMVFYLVYKALAEAEEKGILEPTKKKKP